MKRDHKFVTVMLCVFARILNTSLSQFKKFSISVCVRVCLCVCVCVLILLDVLSQSAIVQFYHVADQMLNV